MKLRIDPAREEDAPPAIRALLAEHNHPADLESRTRYSMPPASCDPRVPRHAILRVTHSRVRRSGGLPGEG
jgi:hypothetical protein